METKMAIQTEDISITSAVETLSTIADMELSSMAADPFLLEPKGTIVVKTMRWLHQKNAERMGRILQEKLRIILHYLKHFYRSEKERFARREALEGIRTIMLLVDEATDNMDRYTGLFLGEQSVKMKDTEEFKELCSFYKKKIVPIETHRQVSTWIGALPIEAILSKKEAIPPLPMEKVKPLSLELEALKEDRDYELLRVRQADGRHFFSPRLIRNMRLACDIERAVEEKPALYEDEIRALRRLHLASEASYLVENTYPALDAFFHVAHHTPHNHLVQDLFGASVALLMSGLAALSDNGEHMAKGVEEYSYDFRLLFSRFLNSTEFKRLLAYPPQNEHSWEYALMRLVETISSHIVMGTAPASETMKVISSLINEALPQAVRLFGDPDKTLSKELLLSSAALRSFLGEMHTSTLRKMLRDLEVRPQDAFEPLLSDCLPTHIFNFSWRGELIPIIRMASPTRQEYISKAIPSEVFQVALHRLKKQNRRCLLINLQDCTHSKESARCGAIDALRSKPDIRNTLTVFTLPRNGDFYTQSRAYEEFSSAELFMQSLLEHMTEPTKGVNWPEQLKGSIRSELTTLIHRIHESFFGGREVLSKAKRLDFIELVHVLAISRVIAESHPDMIFISCKDGVDVTLPTACELYGFFSAIHHHIPQSDEMEWIKTVILGLPLIQRGRLLFADRSERMISFLRFLERMREGTIEERKWHTAFQEFLPHDIMTAMIRK